MKPSRALGALGCAAAFWLATGRVLWAASVLVFPQLVAGGGYVSSVTLVNTNFSSTVTGTLAFFNRDGTPRSLAIDGQGTASTFQVTIPPGGTAVLNTSPASGDAVGGMAKFTSDFPAGGVVRFQFSGGQVGVLSAPVLPFGTLVLNTSGGNDTGIAIANPGTAPVNIRLVHVDAAGKEIESVDPSDLNPLPANGQVSKFVTQFGFTQVANRSTGSIQIQAKGSGSFSAFALLLRDGMLSSTAVVRGVSGKMTLDEFGRAYSGLWRNTSAGGQGEMTVAMSVNITTKTVVINLTLVPNDAIFASKDKQALPTTLIGTYNVNGFTATGTSAVFGPMTLTIKADGAWTFAADSLPDPVFATFRITGLARPDKITGDWVMTLKSGAKCCDGTVVLNHEKGP